MQHSHSEQLGEQISAFLDGELPEHEIELLLRRLDRKPALRATLGRYAAMGETLRGEPRLASSGFGERVAARIAEEEKHQAPNTAVRTTRSRDIPQWLRTAGGAAAGIGIAATVAAVAIISLQRQQPEQTGTQLAGAPAETVVIGESGSRPEEALSYTVPAPTTTRPMVNGAHLADYVLAHSEYSSPLGRRNVLSGIIAEDPTPIDAAGAVPVAESEGQPAKRSPEIATTPETTTDQGSGGGGDDGLQMNRLYNDGPRWYFEQTL